MLQSIPIRSRDFRIEPELTFKLAKRGARIFEVPISYAGRTYEEGKKIGFKDALLALGAMLHWWLIDDIYKPDEYGSNILVGMSAVPHFNRWMADTVRPYVGARVLEVGAGIGNLTRTLLPRDYYTVSDVNPHYLDYLRNFADGKPYMDVRRVDLTCRDDFVPLAGHYDTVICLNVLEHIDDEAGALRNIRLALQPGGRAIILVPQNPALYGTLDEVLGHKRRYTRAGAAGDARGAGIRGRTALRLQPRHHPGLVAQRAGPQAAPLQQGATQDGEPADLVASPARSHPSLAGRVADRGGPAPARLTLASRCAVGGALV